MKVEVIIKIILICQKNMKPVDLPEMRFHMGTNWYDSLQMNPINELESYYKTATAS